MFHAASAQKYVDASTLTIIGRTCPMEGHPYYRVDTTRYRFDNATIRHYCGYPAGVAVLFTTDSRRIEARWTTAPRSYGWNMTPVLQRGMDLYVRENGVWTMAGAARPGLQDRHASTIVEHMDGQPKECMLYLPAWSELLTLEIGVDEGASVTPLESPYKHRVIVFGSSVTHGASASRPGMTYPARMSRMTGIEFEAASDEELLARIGSLKILSRARPLDKQRLVRLLQQQGEVVAVTGDGTNDAPALAQADVGVAMNSGTQAAKEAGNMVDLDNDPTKLIEIVEIGKQLLMTRGTLTTFSIANDVAKYFAIVPALFIASIPSLGALNVMHLHSPESAILSAVIFNALIIPLLIPLALRGVTYKPIGASALLRRNLFIYGLGGVIVPFVGIKLIDMLISVFF